MSHVTQISKLPGEKLSIPIDFVDTLVPGSPGEGIDSAVSVARDKTTGADLTSTIVVGTAFSGSVVTPQIQAGNQGQLIEVDVLATTDLGDIIGHRLDVKVE